MSLEKNEELNALEAEETAEENITEEIATEKVTTEESAKDELVKEADQEISEEKSVSETAENPEMADSPVAADASEPEQQPAEPLSDKQAEAVIEAILFTMGDTVEISKLADTVGLDVRTVKKILKKMEDQYLKDDRGIMLTRFENAVQLCTKPEMYEYLIKIAKTPKKIVLTDTVIETLSIIAYKQPVTRLDVENIRGVNCDHAINKLLEYDLITELGRLDAPGRPILFGTTEQFLRCFGVKSLEDLPELSTVQIAEFKAQAEAEVQLKLDI